MINLLPQDRQDALRRRDWSKIAAAIGILVCAGLAAFVLMLLAVKNFYQSKLNSEQIAIDAKKNEMEIFNVDAIDKQVSYNNKLIGEISDFYARQVKINSIIDKIAVSMPPSLSLYKLVYYSDKVELAGYAPERDSLVRFKNNLEACPEFININFPSSNWLAAKDINFTVNFAIHDKNK